MFKNNKKLAAEICGFQAGKPASKLHR